jgi:hypothetical protein
LDFGHVSICLSASSSLSSGLRLVEACFPTPLQTEQRLLLVDQQARNAPPLEARRVKLQLHYEE